MLYPFELRAQRMTSTVYIAGARPARFAIFRPMVLFDVRILEKLSMVSSLQWQAGKDARLSIANSYAASPEGDFVLTVSGLSWAGR